MALEKLDLSKPLEFTESPSWPILLAVWHDIETKDTCLVIYEYAGLRHFLKTNGYGQSTPGDTHAILGNVPPPKR